MGSTRHEMIREIRRMGFEIENGPKHFYAVDPKTGKRVVRLPHGQHAYRGFGNRNGIAAMQKLRRHLRQKQQ
jgi:hypothetical protein